MPGGAQTEADPKSSPDDHVAPLPRDAPATWFDNNAGLGSGAPTDEGHSNPASGSTRCAIGRLLGIGGLGTVIETQSGATLFTYAGKATDTVVLLGPDVLAETADSLQRRSEAHHTLSRAAAPCGSIRSSDRREPLTRWRRSCSSTASSAGRSG